MASSEHLDVVKRGRYIWNQWRTDHPDARPDLRGAYLREADLRDYNFREADLRAVMMLGGDLRGADLEGADLSFADVRFVDFTGAKLAGARFHESKGVPAWVLSAARGPSLWKRHGAKAAVLAVLTVAAYGVYQSGLVGERLASWTAQAAEVVNSWSDEDEDQEPDAAPELLQRIQEIEGRLTAIEFSNWRIEQVLLRSNDMLVRTDQENLTEAVYLPTLAAACGALAGREDGWTPDRIHVLNKLEQEGWTFESPASCGELIQTPPRVMRLAIAADTRNYSPAEKER